MENVNNSKRKDIIFAVVIYLILFFGSFLIMSLFFDNPNIMIFDIYVTSTGVFILFDLLILVAIFSYIKFRKHKLIDFNLTFTNSKKSFLLGVIVSVIIVLLLLFKFYILEANTDLPMRSTKDYILYFIYILIFVGIYEEVVFRGFMQNIFLNGIKSKIIAIMLVGIMFSFLHIFSFATSTQGTFLELIILKSSNLLSLFCLHCLFYLLSKKYNSLIPAIIAHLAWDFVLFILYI